MPPYTLWAMYIFGGIRQKNPLLNKVWNKTCPQVILNTYRDPLEYV